ncbi:thiamine pyrophosphate-dependent dehydrogenase E1 component subunit alpha [Bacteroidota bacterium]
MYRSRVFEEHVKKLWDEGLITGEMHMSTGEEGINTGVIAQLEDGDAMALDHRGSSASVIRGIDPLQLLLEFLGHEKGLCGGMGGHMHIFSREHLIASSGIVGASGPAATGFALAAKYKRPGKVAVSFFGEGAANQGMMMESFNMASALNLPVLFVCKDNGWAITTISTNVTAGDLVRRAESFEMPAYEVDGSDVEKVWNVASKAINHVRSVNRPAFILAHYINPHGHFLHDPLMSALTGKLKDSLKMGSGLLKATTALKGASFQSRMDSLKKTTGLISKKTGEKTGKGKDPVLLLREKLLNNSEQIKEIESEVDIEMSNIIKKALTIYKETEQS